MSSSESRGATADRILRSQDRIASARQAALLACHASGNKHRDNIDWSSPKAFDAERYTAERMTRTTLELLGMGVARAALAR